MSSKARVKNSVRIIAAQANADKCIAHKDGTWSIKHSYFYSHGNTPQKWADKVVRVFEDTVEVIEARDAYANWPKTSYFVAQVRVVDGAAIVAQAEAYAEAHGMTFAEAVTEARAHFAD